MENKEPIKRYYDKDRNRFMALRFESDTAEYPDITVTDLAEELKYSKGTISSLEAPNLEEHTLLAKQAGLLKAYHDYFDCSYEYLYGECNQPDPKYKSLDASSPLNQLDTKSLNNLEQLLSSKDFENFNAYMLKAFLAEPQALQHTMNIIFRFLYVINEIYTNPSLNQAEMQLKTANLWFTLNNNLDTYLKDSLLPHLQVGFEKFKQKEAEHKAEEDKEAKEKDENLLKVIDEYLEKESHEEVVVTKAKVASVEIVDNKKDSQ